MRFSPKKINIIHLFLCLLVIPPAYASETAFEIYKNARYGFSVTIPKERFSSIQESENGSGLTIRTAGGLEILAFGSFNALDESPYEQICGRVCDGEVNKAQSANEASSSGSQRGDIYIRRCILRSAVFRCFYASGPAEAWIGQEQILENIQKSLFAGAESSTSTASVATSIQNQQSVEASAQQQIVRQTFTPADLVRPALIASSGDWTVWKGPNRSGYPFCVMGATRNDGKISVRFNYHQALRIVLVNQYVPSYASNYDLVVRADNGSPVTITSKDWAGYAEIPADFWNKILEQGSFPLEPKQLSVSAVQTNWALNVSGYREARAAFQNCVDSAVRSGEFVQAASQIRAQEEFDQKISKTSELRPSLLLLSAVSVLGQFDSCATHLDIMRRNQEPARSRLVPANLVADCAYRAHAACYGRETTPACHGFIGLVDPASQRRR
jgi:hypothetical protein